MKYLRQFMIILLFSFLGELLKYVLPFPVPASIYGLVLLFIALVSQDSSPLAAVKDAGKFSVIEIMPLMFIPAGAGLIDAWDALRPICVQIVVIMVVSTIVVMIVSGHVTQFVMRRGKKEGAQQ
ncbi:MAG: CidA/LrgA family protein [Roseburia intestinalis]